MVTYVNWRWIFFINVPLGLVSFWGINAFLVETRPKAARVNLDLAGAAALTTAILAFLLVFLLAGRVFAWGSWSIIGLMVVTAVAAAAFVVIEKRAADPILSLDFFRNRGFAAGNGAMFLSSFVIFSMFAYAPLFIQGAQGRSPMEVGIAMLSLSLGWSGGSLGLGRLVDRSSEKYAAVVGGAGLLAGCIMALQFDLNTSLAYSFVTFLIIGISIGFVSLATLLAVQSSLGSENLGVATSSQQFARSLGGAVGVGISGSFIADRFAGLIAKIQVQGIMEGLPKSLSESGAGQIESLMRPEVQSLLSPELRQMLQSTVVSGVMAVFWVVALSALLCLLFSVFIPGKPGHRQG
jgi:predicted MFS family arabinose efflux permease